MQQRATVALPSLRQFHLFPKNNADTQTNNRAAIYCYCKFSSSGCRLGSTSSSLGVMRSLNSPVPSGHSAPMMMDSLTPTMSSVLPWMAASNKWSARRARTRVRLRNFEHGAHETHPSSSQTTRA